MAAVRVARAARRARERRRRPSCALPRTEAALAAGAPVAEAQRVLADEIHPIDDVRSTADYRRQVAVNLLGAFWRDTGSTQRSAGEP